MDGDTPTPDPNGKTPPAPEGGTVRRTEDGKYVLKYKGEERTVSEGELFQLAQKAEGAERRMQEAHAQEQALGQLLRKTKDGDLDAYQELLQRAGYADAEVQQELTAYREMLAAAQAEGDVGDADPEEGEPPPKSRASGRRSKSSKGDSGEEKPRKLSVDELPDEVVAALSRLNERWQRDTREEVFAAVKSDLESDATVGKIVKKGDRKAARIVELAKKSVISRIRDGEKYGPQLRAAVVKEARELIEELGAGPEPTTPPGIGPGPGLSHAEAQAERRAERKSIFDPDYLQNVRNRMAHDALKDATGPG